jgi:acyl dehydratase
VVSAQLAADPGGLLAPGRSVTISKTVAESDVYLFAGITGDFDPIHLDETHARKTPFGRRIAHGALLLGYMSRASTLIHQGLDRPLAALGFDRVRFVAPVFLGDTVRRAASTPTSPR